jgi:signal transduction histidine kinase/ActR/RegA family two-component response regulator
VRVSVPISGIGVCVKGALARLLDDRRDAIVSRFVNEVQRLDPARPGATRSLLVDHIPQFLDEISAEVAIPEAVRPSQDVVDTSETARQHGAQRWGLGYDLQDVIREYGILRHCILQAAKEANIELSVDEFDLLAKCLNVGVADATVAYIAFRDEELDAQKTRLAFLGEAGELLTSSLDYRFTLHRLTDLLVPRLADWCAVHLDGIGVEGMPLSHVDPAMIDVLRQLYRRYPPPPDSPHGYPQVLRAGEPQLVPDVAPGLWEAAAKDAEHLELLRSINVCSWLTVPLRVQGRMFGALTLAFSDSRRHYSRADLELASELARRAAVAIDNARLYELSQRERSRVEQATRAKDEFVAMVSHELRTPLNAILGWARLMRLGALPESKRQHGLEVIERNAEAQSQIVADLLDISRAITGKIRITSSQMDLANVVESSIDGIRPAADAKGIQIEMDLGTEASVIRGDGERLQQVVWNLLANAIKFTPKNGHVQVRLARTDSEVELTVADDGQGIEPAFLPYVFEAFRQAEGGSAREHGGLGIGLSVAKHIVELHGGAIHAQNQQNGRGAIFTVRLPIGPVAIPTPGPTWTRATAAAASESLLPQGLEGTRVLVVDDEPDAREMVGYALQACGVQVHTVESAAEALKELARFEPQVVVSDIGMPKEDGYSLIRSIRTSPSEATRKLPVIALTAFARHEDRTRALVEGFNLYMEKPIEPAALVRAVAALAKDVS